MKFSRKIIGATIGALCISGVSLAAEYEQLSIGELTLGGTKITATATEINTLAGGTDGQLLVGASGADPAWATVGGDATMAADGTLTVSKGLAMTNGASLLNIPAATALSGIVPLANGGAGNVSGILKANGAGLVSAASSTTDYVAPITQVSGVTTAALVATVTFQSSIAGVQHLTGWLSESAGGVAVGTNVVSIAGAAGTVVLAGGGTGDAYAVWTSKSDGLSTLVITMAGAQAGLYFNTVQNNGVVVSSPAFDVAP